MENKRIEKQKYKDAKLKVEQLKKEIELKQKQQQLEILQRELADKAGQSSSSKNEAHTESQEY